jgi:hypothetical protein
VEAVVGRIVVFLQVRRMALGAHVIPVLAGARPVEHVTMVDVLVRIEMEPALATFLTRPSVPRDGKGLQPPVRKFYQILLQRIDAERVFDLEICQSSIRAVGVDEKLPVAPGGRTPEP